jgi:hypothetical protein
MREETELWRPAGLLVDQKGRDAVRLAIRHSRELERQGDLLGAANWRTIADAIRGLTPTVSHG